MRFGGLGSALAPLLVVGLSLGPLTRPAERAPDETVAQQEKLAAAGRRELIVAGASYAYADFHLPTLARALELGSAPAAFLVRASPAPVWYAMLKERVYANGVDPAVVLLAVSFAPALTVALDPGAEQKLLAQMPEPDAVVTRRSYGVALPPALHRVVQRKAELRDPILGAFRAALPGLVQGVDAAGVDAAGEAVFPSDHDEAGPRAIPVVESRERGSGSGLATDPAESYLEDIADLVQGRGGRLVIVVPPVAPGVDQDPGVSPEQEAAVYRWANARGVGLLDLRELGWAEPDFVNGHHMTPEAARRFSQIVAARLQDLGAMEEGPMRPSVVPPHAITVERVGPLPPAPVFTEAAGLGGPCDRVLDVGDLAVLGTRQTELVAAKVLSPIEVWEGDERLGEAYRPDRCGGAAVHRARILVSRKQADGPPLRLAWAEAVPQAGDPPQYWVYPGTSLRWSFAEPWRAPGLPELRVEALAFGPRRGSATVEVRAASTPLVPEGDVLRARLAAPTDGAWTLSVTSPSGGPFVLVRGIELSAGEQHASILDTGAEARRDLLVPGSWTVQGSLPPLPELPVGGEDGRNWLVVPWKNRLGCSPLRVEEDGRLLPRAPRDLWRSARPPAGGTQHAEDRLWFDAEGDARENGKSYRAVYDQDRACRAGPCGDGSPNRWCRAWLYPADLLRIELSAQARAHLGGARLELALAASANEPVEGPALRVRVGLDEAWLVETELGAEALRAGARVALPEALPRQDPRQLRIELESLGTVPLLLASSMVAH